MSNRSDTTPGRRRMRHTVLTSVLAAGALTAATVTTAAVTLTGSEPRPTPEAATSSATSTSTEAPSLAEPVEVRDVRRAVAPVSLVVQNGAQIDDIPSVAIAAYQRAEGVMTAADRRCRLGWTLVAAVGQVVSEHGSRDGGRLTSRGVVRPAMIGRYVRNEAGRRLTDTDAGRLDGDKDKDRAVGPMLLAPTTWGVIGVDSDGDGSRNPQDVDDAALAVSVLLCSGKEDLRERRDRRASIARINDDRAFVRAVMATDDGFRFQLANTPGPAVVAVGAPIDLPTMPVAVKPSPEQPSDPVTLSTVEDVNLDTPPSTQAPTQPDDDPTTTEPTDPTDPTTEPTDPTTKPSDPTTKPSDPTTDPTKDPTDPTTEPTEPTEDPCETTPTAGQEPSDAPTDEPCPTSTAAPSDTSSSPSVSP